MVALACHISCANLPQKQRCVRAGLLRRAGAQIAIQHALFHHWGSHCLPAASHNSEWAWGASKAFQVTFCLWKRNPTRHREAELAAAQGAAADGCPWRAQQCAHGQRGHNDLSHSWSMGWAKTMFSETKKSYNLWKPWRQAFSKGPRQGTRPCHWHSFQLEVETLSLTQYLERLFQGAYGIQSPLRSMSWVWRDCTQIHLKRQSFSLGTSE